MPHKASQESLGFHFSLLVDPRVQRTQAHSLHDILMIALCALLCGAESFVEFERFGEAKRDWLARFLKLPNGIPSHDTFGRVFALLDPRQFSASISTIALNVSLRHGREGFFRFDGLALNPQAVRRVAWRSQLILGHSAIAIRVKSAHLPLRVGQGSAGRRISCGVSSALPARSVAFAR